MNLLTARKTSDRTASYNCVAFAAGDTTRWWWPGSEDSFWPAGTPDEETLSAFIAAFSTLGYSPCDTGDLEARFEKIAIYANAQGTPTHVAHQMADGKWESKLGSCIDIRHDTLTELGNSPYGNVACYLKRSRRQAADGE